MQPRHAVLAMTLSAALALAGVVFQAVASTPLVERAGGAVPVRWWGAVSASPSSGPATAACNKMTAGDVAWVTLNDEGDIHQQVESYPSGTTGIVPVFEYNCVPKKTNIVTVFALDGETVYTDKEALQASNSSSFYGYPLSTTDDSPLGEGEWSVEFYNNKTLLTSGIVIVGDAEGSDRVTVVGTVKDAKTKKGIKGALILVLNPDVTVQDFVDGGQKDEDVFTAAKTDGKGQFELEAPLARNAAYSIIIVAKGYQPIAQDGLEITDDDPNPLELTITLTK